MVLVKVQTAFADDKCKAIENLDNRAKCYADKIQNAQNDYASTNKKLTDILNQKDSVLNKISQLSSKLSATQGDLDDLQNQINTMKKELDEINKNLSDRKDSFQKKLDLRNKILRRYYQSGILNDLETFLGTPSSGNLNGFRHSTFSFIFEKSTVNDASKIMTILNSEISNFENDKKKALDVKNELEKAQNQLVALKTSLDNEKKAKENQAAELAKQQTSYEGELKSLQDKINDLSQKQQAILNLKGGDSSSVGDFAAPEYTLPDPPFSPAFAAMSYGAYTHNNGMSQYGAKGRAEDGQDYKEILKFYYKVDVEEKDDFPDSIQVSGFGEMDFQKYLYGIAEMPSTWPEDALKAQAIAARTYAYRSSKPICTTESCQVFLKSKSDNPPSKWKKAVDDTENKILKDPKTAQYSSTTGGYINNVGWDSKGGWPGGAYEKRANSPWFYKAWYTKSYSPSSDKCGHPHPWLTQEEMADILNAVVVWEKSNGNNDHISPVTTSCWGGDPYSHDEMANKASEYGEKYSKVNSASVDISNGGYTSKVIFSTDKGSVSIDGQTFKTVFNLRAPAYISIKNRLFGFEKK